MKKKKIEYVICKCCDREIQTDKLTKYGCMYCDYRYHLAKNKKEKK